MKTTLDDTAALRARMLARIDAERAAKGQPIPEWPDPVPAFTLAEYEAELAAKQAHKA